MPQYVIVDADTGRAEASRLRAVRRSADTRNALLVECGQHWEAAAPIVAQQVMLRFLQHFEMMDRAFVDAHVDAGELPVQQTIAITDVDDRDRRSRRGPVAGMMCIAHRDTLIARDGDREIRTPHDDCVLIMPTRRPQR